jgi:hypothetical protein
MAALTRQFSASFASRDQMQKNTCVTSPAACSAAFAAPGSLRSAAMWRSDHGRSAAPRDKDTTVQPFCFSNRPV